MVSLFPRSVEPLRPRGWCPHHPSCESKKSSNFQAKFAYKSRWAWLFNYVNTSFPSAYTPANTNVRAVNYFDTYTWQTDGLFNFDASKAFGTQWTGQGATFGMATGSLERNLETLDFYKSVNYFDFKGRVIQSHIQNHVGGIDRLNVKYSFTGEILKALKLRIRGRLLVRLPSKWTMFMTIWGGKLVMFTMTNRLLSTNMM